VRLLAFLRKDLFTAASYRAALALGLCSLVMVVFSYAYLAGLVGAGNPHLARYGGQYLPFVLIGLAVTDFFTGWLYSLSQAVREAQVTGTLEAMLLSPAPAAGVIGGMMTFPLLAMLLNCGAYVALGIAFLGLDFHRANWLAAGVVGGLAFLVFSGLALLSAAFVLVFKKGDPVAWLFSATAYLLCGTLYPVELLPSWLQQAAQLVPLTAAIDGLRLALLQGYPVGQLGVHWKTLAVFAALLLPLGLTALGAALRYLRIHGGLTHY
jgi:ABC-2 type transport system permease protein